jgi:hypothetical protein
MFGLILIGCGIYGTALGYLAADAIESARETDKIIDDMNQCIDELSSAFEKHEKLIKYTEEEIEKILSETEEPFKESVRAALEVGVEPERLIKNKEDVDKLFG